MENAKNVDVVLADFDWSDLGTWSSLYSHLDKDVKGNAVNSEEIHVIDSENCLINLPSGKKAIIQGLRDHIVVESGERLLIINKRDEQNLKKYLNSLT